MTISFEGSHLKFLILYICHDHRNMLQCILQHLDVYHFAVMVVLPNGH